jgi:excisionase family DNA binding protein
MRKTMPAITEASRRLTVEDVAARWEVSIRTVRRLVDRGELKCLRIGRQMRFTAEDLAAYERAVRS